MDDDRPWLGEEPSARPDLTFPPVLTALALFLAVAGPICFVGIAHEDGADIVVVVVGLFLGFVVALLAYVAQTVRGGRGPDVRGRL
ncbi:MAG TPA: hypothetical protein VGI54_01025 [Solirubrobacteraceae bacterium]|jgi:VIT1/CCC1 family predicted Fe2+/Mn2+ transporter